jgi:hypothetical protein
MARSLMMRWRLLMVRIAAMSRMHSMAQSKRS